MGKIKVLFLMDDPFTTTRQQLDEEMLEIRHQLQKLNNTEAEMLEFISAWALNTDDLRKELELHKPHIVHFIGHSSSKGIVLKVFKKATPIDARELDVLFVGLKKPVSLVILNGCYVPQQVGTLQEFVKCVIGTESGTAHDTTILFASHLYNCIIRGKSIQATFDHAKSVLPTSVQPKLQEHIWIDLEKLVLLPSPTENPAPSSPVTGENNVSILPHPKPVELFIAYVHEDQELRDRLLKHLDPLRKGLIATWYDSDVSQKEWLPQTYKHFNKAQIIILLISPDFMVLDFSTSTEIKSAIERHRRREVYVIPVMLRSVMLRGTPFSTLSMLPREGKPMVEWSDLDQVCAEVARGIRMVIEELQKPEAAPVQHSPDSHSTDQTQTSTTLPPYDLVNVFVKSGFPKVTFVESDNFIKLKDALRDKNRGVIIEGPPGIGKTTAVQKAIEEMQHALSLSGNSCPTITTLTAHNPQNLNLLHTLREWHTGIVIIDDFHRLDSPLKLEIAEYLKQLTDDPKPETKKLVLVGIPQSGQALVDLLDDLAMRIDIIKFIKVKDELVLQMVKKGEEALNVELDRRTDLVLRANGSLSLAQFLCRNVCQQDKVSTTLKDARIIYCDVNKAIENVQDHLSTKFEKAVRFFASMGDSQDITCLRLLQELAAREDGILSLNYFKERKPDLAYNIDLFINQHWLEKLYERFPDSKSYLFFDQSRFALVIDDPNFAFYLANLQLGTLAREVGKVIALKRHKVFLCHHRQDIVWLERVRTHLAPLRRVGIIEQWDETQISAGTSPRNTVHKAIETAKVAILLVSAEFLACDFITDDQLPRLLAQAKKEDAMTIIPIILAPCLFDDTELKDFEPINSPDRPLVRMRKVEWQETLVKLAKVIKQKFAEDDPF